MGGKRIQPGDKFGRLIAREMTYKVSRSGRSRPHWICDCDCGGAAEVDSGNLRSGNTRWCRSCASAYKAKHRATHGHTRNLNPSKAYRAWRGAKRRIFDVKDKRFPDYGGRGLDMSPRWAESFDAFLSDMGEPPTPDHQIERIDNDRGYWPDNCRWADRYEQGANKRNNVVIEWRGRKATLSEWCRETGVSFDVAKARHYRHPFNGDKIFAQGRLRAISYEVDGRRFGALSEVASEFGISISGAHSRFKSGAFPGWIKRMLK